MKRRLRNPTIAISIFSYGCATPHSVQLPRAKSPESGCITAPVAVEAKDTASGRLIAFTPPAGVDDFPPELANDRRRFRALWSGDVARWTSRAIEGLWYYDNNPTRIAYFDPLVMGVHGMVVVGRRTVFMSHIPMCTSPHDMQIVLKVHMAQRLPTFADALYTFKPKPFSLDSLVGREIIDIVGTTYRGNFEAGGQPILENSRVHVDAVLVNRVACASDASTDRREGLTYFLFGDGDDAYLLHRIVDAPSFDQIVRVRVSGGDAATLKKGLLVRLPKRSDSVQHRLRAGDVETFGPYSLTTEEELSCLVGPGFYEACH